MKIPAFEDLILLETEDFLVVNKPPYIASLEDRGDHSINLLMLARKYTPDAQLCHRLDKETSGCLIIAKNPNTYRHISIQFEKRRVNKIYHAIADGIHDFNNLEVNLPMDVTRSGKVIIDKANGKDALTIFQTLKTFRHYTLIECRPLTGRMHQIRVHLATQNASIAGDELYGGKAPMLSQLKRKFKLSKREEEEQPIMRRVALHAYGVSFRDLQDKPVNVEAPYPKDFEVFLRLLEKHDGA